MLLQAGGRVAENATAVALARRVREALRERPARMRGAERGWVATRAGLQDPLHPPYGANALVHEMATHWMCIARCMHCEETNLTRPTGVRGA
jgi:hypothetical protein